MTDNDPEQAKRNEQKAARFRAKMATVGITPGQLVLEMCNCEAIFPGYAEVDDIYGLHAAEIIQMQCDIVEFNATHTIQFIFHLYRSKHDKSIHFKVLCDSAAHMSVEELLETIALFRPYMFAEVGVFSDFVTHLVDEFPRNREREPASRLLEWPDHGDD
jgi:hypothetical protein